MLFRLNRVTRNSAHAHLLRQEENILSNTGITAIHVGLCGRKAAVHCAHKYVTKDTTSDILAAVLFFAIVVQKLRVLANRIVSHANV